MARTEALSAHTLRSYSRERRHVFQQVSEYMNNAWMQGFRLHLEVIMSIAVQ